MPQRDREGKGQQGVALDHDEHGAPVQVDERPVVGGELDLREQKRADQQQAQGATLGDHQGDGRQGPDEVLGREDLAEGHEGEDQGEHGERYEAGRRAQGRAPPPDETVGESEGRELEKARDARQGLSAGRGDELRAVSGADLDPDQVEEVPRQQGRGQHALDLERPVELVGEGVLEPLDAVDHEGHERQHGGHREIDQAPADRPPAHGQHEDQRQQDGGRQLEGEAYAQHERRRRPQLVGEQQQEHSQHQGDGGVVAIADDGAAGQHASREGHGGEAGSAAGEPEAGGGGGDRRRRRHTGHEHLDVEPVAVSDHVAAVPGQDEQRYGQRRVFDRKVDVGPQAVRHARGVVGVDRCVGDVVQAIPDVSHAEEVDDEADGHRREADAERDDFEEAVLLAAGPRLGRRGQRRARGAAAAVATAGVAAAAVGAARRRADSRRGRGVPGLLGATRLTCHAAIPVRLPPMTILI